MARLDPKLIQQGEESTSKKVKLRGHTTRNSLIVMPTPDSEYEPHSHEFIVYEDNTVEILPHIDNQVLTASYGPYNSDITAPKDSHTHEYIGFYPDGVVVENNWRGFSHTHKILGGQEKIDVIQPMFRDVGNVINTDFTEIFQSAGDQIPSIKKFFSFYQRLFYNIPKEGANSHTFLVNESLGYINNYAEPNSEEILELTNRIVELEQELAEKDTLDKEHPVFQNGTFLKEPDKPTVYYMDKGQKRAIDNMEVFNILKRTNGHAEADPNEEVIIPVTEDVIKGLETGPKFRSEDLYGDEEQRKQEEKKKLVKLDPDDFIADPNNYDTVEDYLKALDRETRQLLAKEEYLQELYYRYKFDSENLDDVDARRRAKDESKDYLGELGAVRRKILRYTDILESVDPDGDLQNLEIDKSQLKKVVEEKTSRNTFTQEELEQLRSKKNTIERFLESDKSVRPDTKQNTSTSTSDFNTGTGAGNNSSAYLAAAGLGDASGYAAEEQPKRPPGGFTPNPSGLIKNHTVQEAINLMQLGKKSPQGNWYWSLKVNRKNEVDRAKETGKWRLYENNLSNPLINTPKPNSHWNWRKNDFEWAPMPGKFPGMKDRVWEGKVIHKLKPKGTTNEERRPTGGRSGTGLY